MLYQEKKTHNCELYEYEVTKIIFSNRMRLHPSPERDLIVEQF